MGLYIGRTLADIFALTLQHQQSLAESPGLVVMGDDSCLKGRWFKSRRRILDGNDIFHIDFL